MHVCAFVSLAAIWFKSTRLIFICSFFVFDFDRSLGLVAGWRHQDAVRHHLLIRTLYDIFLRLLTLLIRTLYDIIWSWLRTGFFLALCDIILGCLGGRFLEHVFSGATRSGLPGTRIFRGHEKESWLELVQVEGQIEAQSSQTATITTFTASTTTSNTTSTACTKEAGTDDWNSDKNEQQVQPQLFVHFCGDSPCRSSSS